jgi:hypothetical protein
MTKYLPLATAFACLGFLALAVFLFDPSCLLHYPLPQKNALPPTMAEVLERKEQLQRLGEDFNRYLEAKDQVAKEVIAGRRSLAEAIEEFRRLDQPWISANYQEQTLKALRISEKEWRGRNVIAFARRVLADRPDEAAAVTDRLEKELQKLVADRKKTRSTLSDLRREKWNR